MVPIRRALALASLLLGAVACAPTPNVYSRGQNANAFDPINLTGNVRSESVNEYGEFIASETVADPMEHKYEDTLWVASKTSKATTIRSNTVLNRINLVFVGDGYPQSALVQYANDVEANTKRIFLQEPFRTYQNYFAVHRVDVVSPESGITEETPGVRKKTALEMTYNCSGIRRLLCINLNKVMQQAQNAPKVDAIFSIGNSATYGGAGYASPAVSTFAARNPESLELALHEFAHSFAGLIDEYDANGIPARCTSFANSSAQSETEMQRAKSKWYRWLDLPQVGSFKGSCYSMKFYRPTMNSKMRTLGQPFDVVNAEQFILKFYEKIRPIEFATPPGIIEPGSTIQVVPMRPNGHQLAISWRVNGSPVTSLQGRFSVSIKSLGLKKGAHSVSATVIDPTPMVRDELARLNLMSQSLSWSVMIN